MGFSEWAKNSYSELRSNPVQGVKDATYDLYEGGWRRLGKSVNFGDSIWKEDWDVLIVLDSCRYDLFEEVRPDYDSLGEAGVHISNGSSSAEWIAKNFRDEEDGDLLSETVYVSGNPFTDNVLYEKECPKCGESWSRRSRWETVRDVCQHCGETVDEPSRTPIHGLKELVEVWDFAWDYDNGTIQPRPVTDSAIRTARETNPERLAIHYMQPHYPLVNDSYSGSVDVPFDEVDGRVPWHRLRRGDLALQELWGAYKANLETVLAEVDLLLDNVEGDVVITSDHGNAIGEWGLYGHIMHAPVRPIKKVPWCRADATDKGTHTPAEYRSEQDTVNKELLDDLGYI